MAILNVPDANETITSPDAIRAFLAPYGIWYERWPVEGRIGADASSEEILSAYAAEVDRLKKEHGYVTADVINVVPDTPGLSEMLNKFNKEHTHSEDEVRFLVKGHGIFHINPVTDKVFSIEMEAGDLINVPAGTRHWFNLCADRTIRTIRLFKDMSGWSPEYLDNGVHASYQPLCFSPQSIVG